MLDLIGNNPIILMCLDKKRLSPTRVYNSMTKSNNDTIVITKILIHISKRCY